MEDNGYLENGEQPRSRFQLDEGIRLAQEGDRAGARLVFQQIIHYEPDNEDAWLWLAWVAEDKQQGLQYLREAEMLLPDSERLSEAMEWMGARSSPSVGQSDEGDNLPGFQPRTSRKAARDKAKGTNITEVAAEGILSTARAAHQSVTDALSLATKKAATVRMPRGTFYRLRGLVVPVASLLAIAALAAFVMMGIAKARSEIPVVRAQSLPTPIVDATTTPTVKQRTDPLWVQVDVAFTRQDWKAAVSALDRIREADPHNDEARKSLAVARYHYGLELLQANDLAGAQAQLDWAIRLDAGNEELQQMRRQVTLYIDAVNAYWSQDWVRVTERLEKAYAMDPNFRDTGAMLAQAYYERGVERQNAEDWQVAHDSFQRALDLKPDLSDAQTRLAAVNDALVPPKRIEVDLSDHLATVYEDNVPKWVFRVCIGRPSAPTVPGRYQIQTKMPMAYASQWDLDMPWWLGIYYAGGSENGFHALPILSNGQILWRGSLGTGCSFGCIVLDTDDAKALYDWAELGTVVFVNP